MVEQLSVKQCVVGSSPTILSFAPSIYASVAQLVERRIEAPSVGGSTPSGGTTEG